MKTWSLEAFALAWAASASAASARASACARAARKAMISFRGEPAFMTPVYPKAAGETPVSRSYVATATTSGLQGTVDMTIITQSFQEDTGYGRTACRCRFEGQAGRVIRQHRRSGEADRPAPGRSSAC